MPVDGVRSFKTSVVEDYLAVLKTHMVEKTGTARRHRHQRGRVLLVAGTCPSLRGIRRSIPVV